MRSRNGVLHARLAVLAFAGAVALLTASTAGAGTTSVSTVSMSGSDATTSSTATSGGAAGSTAGGDTIQWSIDYRNLTGVDAGFDLRDVIGSGQTFVPGSLQLPPGLTGRWSANGGATFSATEPASGVNAVGAAGSTIDGSTGDQVVVQPDPSSGFVGGVAGGDGWEALFIDDNVYNIHHHRYPGGAKMIDCHVKATGASCPGYAGGGTFASATAGDPLGTGADTLTTAAPNNGVADRTTGHIYFPAGVQNTTDIGVGCIDVRAGASCGYTHLGTAPFQSVTYSQVFGGTAIGSKYYLMDATGAIYCFDMSTQAACTGPNAGGLLAPTLTTAPDNLVAFRSEVESFDGRYVFGNLLEGNGNRDLICFDTQTGNACAGYPIKPYGGVYNAGGTGVYNLVLAPLKDTAGALTGVCGASSANLAVATWTCYGLTGTLIGAPPWGQRIAGTTVNWVGYGSILNVGNRLYFGQTNNTTQAVTYTCWDFSISADCAGFVPASTGVAVRDYTIRRDPYAPDCIWAVGDAGVFEVFSATFGGSKCQGSSSVVAAVPASHYCDGSSGHATAWTTLEIGGVTAADYDGLAVTITGIDGSVVPGWDNRVFPDTQQSIDISSIPITGNTASLNVSVSFDNLAPGATANVSARFAGDPVQVCFKTRVAPAQCTGTPPITNDARIVTTVPGGGVTDAPGGNPAGTVTFGVANNAALCPPPPPPPSPPRADLEVLKRVNLAVVDGNEPVTWTVTVTNHGPDAAVGTAALDDPSLPVTFILVRSSVGSCTQVAPIRCNLGTLAPGAVVNITMIARPKVAGPLKNTVRVSSNTPDPTPFNNVASTATGVRANPPLRITKVANKSSVHAGRNVGYRIKVTNPSSVAVQTVEVCDRLPAGLVFVSSSPNAKRDGGRYCWHLQTVAAHASKSIRLQTRTLRGARGIRRNTATVTGRGVAAKTAAARVNVLAAGAVRAGGVTG